MANVRYILDHLNHDELVGEPGGGGVDEAPVDGEAYGRRNESWDRVLRLGGGRLDGALGVPNGTVANPGLQFGAADGTGFSRALNTLVLSLQGSMVAAFFSGASGSAQFYAPVILLGNRILQVGDPTAASDALNLRTGDWRYLRTDIGGITNGLIRFDGDNLGLLWQAGGGVYEQIAGLTLRRSTGQANLWTEAQDGTNRQPLLDQAAADSRYLQLEAGGIISGPVQVLTKPVIANDAANKGYVDDAVAAAVVPTAFRTFAFTPNDFPIFAPSGATPFLDVNVTLPGGLRNVLISIDPVFASNEPTGTTIWELYYSTDLIALESPVVAYKIANTPTAFFRSSAKITAAVDATSGSVRVVVRVRCTASGGSLTQVGVGGTIAASMRTLVTVQDLGPV